MDTLADIARLVRECTDCPLHQGRTQAVPGEGPDDAELLLIGEGPGVQEDRQGRPFVGPAGGFLEELLQSVGMSRDQVYIANMVKCRPPNNRDPAPGEIAACAKYLDRQIELLNPRLIVTLGRFAMSRFLPGQSISRARGRLRAVNGRQIYPIMHPAAGLRRQEMKDAIVEDFQRLGGLLEVLRMDVEPPSAAGLPAHSASDGNVIGEDAMEYAETAAAAPPEAEPALSLWGTPAAAPAMDGDADAGGGIDDNGPDVDGDGELGRPPAPSYDNPPPGQRKLF